MLPLDSSATKPSIRVYPVSAIDCDKIDDMNSQVVVNGLLSHQTPVSIADQMSNRKLVSLTSEKFDRNFIDDSKSATLHFQSLRLSERKDSTNHCESTSEIEEPMPSSPISTKCEVSRVPSQVLFPSKSSFRGQQPQQSQVVESQQDQEVKDHQRDGRYQQDHHPLPHRQQQQQQQPPQRPASPTLSVASSHLSATAPVGGFKTPRERFLVFIKILFKCLEQANEPEVKLRAKKIVSECTRKNRMGDPKFTPLMEAVEKRLRSFISEPIWRRALLYLRFYVTKRNSQANSSQLPDPIQSAEV